MNFGDDVFMNPWPFMVELYRRPRCREIVPEFELFDLGPCDGAEPAAGLVRGSLLAGMFTVTW